MFSKKVLVTGATGRIGREVVRLLEKADATVVAAMRHPDEGKDLFGAEVDLVHLDFMDPKTFQGAVEGCQRLFLLRPPAISDTQSTLNVLIDIAFENGVEHVVFVSVAGAENNKWVPHHKVEQHLKRGEGSYTILRPGFFSQNLETYLEDIVEDDRIYLPAGNGSVAFIDTRDIAEVAATCLLESEHSNQEYLLTGQECLSFYEVAQILTEELGRHIVYQPASILGYLWHLWKNNIRGVKAFVYTFLHADLRRGSAEKIDPTLKELLRREPWKMREYVRDYRRLWMKRSRG